jgi:[ribosomal protein S5]-alanine N-acetyltransferase
VAHVFDTARLRLRQLALDDAGFILELVTDPLWLRFIGDRGVHDVESARRYLESGPLEMYRSRGFGLWLVERRADAVPIGICGVLKRDSLDDPDLGFAFLPAYRGQGYAREAAAATLEHARQQLGIQRVLAITSPENLPSANVLRSVGMRFEQSIRLKGEDRDTWLFVWPS